VGKVGSSFDTETPYIRRSWFTDARQSLASSPWFVKFPISALVIVVGLGYGILALYLSIPFITPIWFALWWNENPHLWSYYPGVGFLMLWTILFGSAWLDLHLHERREWSLRRLGLLAARAIFLSTLSVHIICLGAVAITGDYFWLGTLIFFVGAALLVMPASDMRHAWRWSLFPNDEPTTFNDRLGYLVVAVIGAILVFMFALMGANWN
jgi:hypothetical protein